MSLTDKLPANRCRSQVNSKVNNFIFAILGVLGLYRINVQLNPRLAYL